MYTSFYKFLPPEDLLFMTPLEPLVGLPLKKEVSFGLVRSSDSSAVAVVVVWWAWVGGVYSEGCVPPPDVEVYCNHWGKN